jgi:hypothetical protein
VVSDSEGNVISTTFQVTFTEASAIGTETTASTSTSENNDEVASGTTNAAASAPNSANPEVAASNDAAAINPISLSGDLADQFATESVFEYFIPEDTFQHSNPEEILSYLVVLEDGTDLPGFVEFDAAQGRLIVDADAARDAGIDSISVRVTAIDSEGNQATSNFTINFSEEPVEAIDLSGDQAAVKIDQAVENQIDPGKASLAKQVQRAGEFGYQQDKQHISSIISALFG